MDNLQDNILDALLNSRVALSTADMSHKLDVDRSVISKAIYKLRVEKSLVERSADMKKYQLTKSCRDAMKSECADDEVKIPEIAVKEAKKPEKEEEMQKNEEVKQIDTSGFSSVELEALHSELIEIEAKISSEVQDQDVKEIVLNSLIESTGGKVAEILESIRDNDVLR